MIFTVPNLFLLISMIQCFRDTYFIFIYIVFNHIIFKFFSEKDHGSNLIIGMQCTIGGPLSLSIGLPPSSVFLGATVGDFPTAFFY